MSLELRGITAGYGSNVVLRSVDLVVPDGCRVALIGANGAGKTTLLRVASGLLRPQAGNVTLDGTTLRAASPHARMRRGLCHVPEGRAIFPALTVRENLRFFARLSDSDLLDRVSTTFPNLAKRLDQTAGTMSGGEQQMLALSRAFVTEPRYVLLDEVSLGLGPLIVDQIFEVLETLASQGVAVLLVEQYVHRALDFADFAYVLRRGSLAFAGEPSELDTDRLAAEYLALTV